MSCTYDKEGPPILTTGGSQSDNQTIIVLSSRSSVIYHFYPFSGKTVTKILILRKPKYMLQPFLSLYSCTWVILLSLISLVYSTFLCKAAYTAKLVSCYCFFKSSPPLFSRRFVVSKHHDTITSRVAGASVMLST